MKTIVADVEFWTALLDEFETALHEYRRRFEQSQLGPAPTGAPRFVPPASVPPIPMVLRSRAVLLSQQADELIAEVSTAADRIKPHRAAPRARVAASTASTAVFDEKA